MVNDWLRGGLLIFVFAGLAFAQDDPPAPPKKRFNIAPDLKAFPQANPKETLESVIKAIQINNLHYLAAHLAEPKFVDLRVDDIRKDINIANKDEKTLAAFDKLVREFGSHFAGDPQIVRELRTFAKEAEWDTGKDDFAVGTAKSISARKVFLRKLDGRWFLENRQQ